MTLAWLTQADKLRGGTNATHLQWLAKLSGDFTSRQVQYWPLSLRHGV
jgi:hypothetical protein